jgi:hypothetical protein
MCQQLVAVIAEGCSIRRDELLGYVVECGQPQTRPLQAATLAAAYALFQQLVPRRWRDNQP